MEKGQPMRRTITQVGPDFLEIFPLRFIRGSAATAVWQRGPPAALTRAGRSPEVPYDGRRGLPELPELPEPRGRPGAPVERRPARSACSRAGREARRGAR